MFIEKIEKFFNTNLDDTREFDCSVCNKESVVTISHPLSEEALGFCSKCFNDFVKEAQRVNQTI